MSNKVPQIRFNGYSDDWVENQLGSLIKIERQQEIKKEKLTDTPEGYYVLAMRTFSKEGYIDFSKPYWIKSDIEDKDAFLLPGEFAIIDADMDVSLPKIGKVLINSYNKKFLLAAHVRKVNVQNNVNSYFMYGLMRTDQLLRRLKKEASGSIAQGLLDKNIYKQNVYIPAIFEQAKIGLFLKEFENIITLHQRKLDLLKEQKKGYLQKMFPKNGAKIPELRFAGFADDWEERKLSEIGKIVTGNTPNTSNKDYYNGDFLFVSPADIQENRYVNKTTTTLTELGFKTGRLVPKGATLFVSIGSTIGKTGQSICDVITNQQINSVISFSDYDDDFIYTSILNSSTKIKQLAATQAVPIINKNEFGKSIIKIPSLEEQQKIGAFFKQLDDIIALHQRKLDLLKEQKKGFLQKMFV